MDARKNGRGGGGPPPPAPVLSFALIYFLVPATQATMTSTKIRLLYFEAQQRLKQICIVKRQP